MRRVRGYWRRVKDGVKGEWNAVVERYAARLGRAVGCVDDASRRLVRAPLRSRAQLAKPSFVVKQPRWKPDSEMAEAGAHDAATAST